MCSVWAQKTRLKFGLTWVGFQEENAHRGLGYTAQGSPIAEQRNDSDSRGVVIFCRFHGSDMVEQPAAYRPKKHDLQCDLSRELGSVYPRSFFVAVHRWWTMKHFVVGGLLAA
jgi:hypothetical protein